MAMETLIFFYDHYVLALVMAGILLWNWRLEKQVYKLQQLGKSETADKGVNHSKDKEIDRLNAQCDVAKQEMERIRLEMNQQSQIHKQAVETHQAETERLKVNHQIAMETQKQKHEEDLARMKLNHETEMDKIRLEHKHQLEMVQCKSRQDIQYMLQSILERLPATQITTDDACIPAN